MKRLFTLVCMTMVAAVMIAIAFIGCATMQKVTEFLNPQYHEIVLNVAEGKSLVLNAPMDWPVELATSENMLIPIVFPLADYAIQGDGFIYEIMFNVETLDVYTLSKTPGVFYNFDVEKTVWYLYLNGKPVISDVKGFLRFIDEVMNGLQEEITI